MQLNRCKYFLAVGFLGKRSDHYLGAFSTILRNPDLKVILVNKYDVIFLNDNITTMEFVIRVLKQIFNKSQEQAENITKKIGNGKLN